MCRRLDGSPLALELAAAWLRTLTPGQIAAGLDDRFALLVGGPRGGAPRPHHLAAARGRLAGSAGASGREAARAVADGGTLAGGDLLSSLRRLVDKSLVIAEE